MMRRGWKGYGGEARGRLPVEGGTGARGEGAGEEGRRGEGEAEGGGGAGAAVCEDAGVTGVEEEPQKLRSRSVVASKEASRKQRRR